jgi:hypothetical protein
MAKPEAVDTARDRPKDTGLIGRWASAKRGNAVVGSIYFAVLALVSSALGTWTDEEYTLATTAHGFAYGWHRAIDVELQAPLYFAVLGVWRELDAGVWFARLFSVLCSTAFFFALLPILRRIAPNKSPTVPALLIACNPFVIYCAFDIRLYAAALLISALMWLTFDSGFASDGSKLGRVAFCILAVLGLYTQYFLGFALVGFGVMLLFKKKWSALRDYAIALAAIGLTAIPLLSIVRSQVGGSGETTAGAASLIRGTFVQSLLNFVLPYDHIWDRFHLRTPYVVLIVAIIVLVVYARPRLQPILGATVACVVAMEMLFVAVVLVFHLDLNSRHYVALFVPALISGYALVTTLEASQHRRIATIIAWSYGVLALTLVYAQHFQLAQDGDTVRVAEYLETRTPPGAIVAVFPADALPAYARQYHGSARLVPFPRALPDGRYDLSQIDANSEAEVSHALAAYGSTRPIWLVMLGLCDDGGFQYGCGNVLASVADDTQVLSERLFYKSRVLELRVKPTKASP